MLSLSDNQLATGSTETDDTGEATPGMRLTDTTASPGNGCGGLDRSRAESDGGSRLSSGASCIPRCTLLLYKRDFVNCITPSLSLSLSRRVQQTRRVRFTIPMQLRYNRIPLYETHPRCENMWFVKRVPQIQIEIPILPSLHHHLDRHRYHPYTDSPLHQSPR